MKNIPYSWIGRFNIVKMAVLPKLNYRFNAVFIKIPEVLVQVDKLILKLTHNYKGLGLEKTVLLKKNKGGLICPNFKMYLQKSTDF